MIRRILETGVRVLVLLCLTVAGSAFGQSHPRLLFGSTDITALRAKINTEPFKSMAAAIDSEANTGLETGSIEYTNDMRAVNSAFMYVLTGDAAWAAKAKIHMDTVLNGANWAKTTVKGLTLFMNGKSMALAFDMCYEAFDATYRTSVSAKLKAQADVINDNGGTEQNTDPASNWQGNRYASAGLCYLASDDTYDPVKFNNCWSKVVNYCTQNMGNDSLSRGWNIEGIGYTTYPWGGFMGPYGIAMLRKDATKDLRTQMASVKWTCWTIFASGCRIQYDSISYGLHPDFGDDNPGLGGEGVYGQAFYYGYTEHMPGLKYWYNRMVGSLGSGNFDRKRQGALYGYLFYPASVIEKDPMTIDKWRSGFVDTKGNGYLTYRNRYRDKDDMVAQLYAKLRGNKGHNGPDALSFRILGMDTPWGVGGGRYGGAQISGHDPYISSMNTLYPGDPDGTLTTNGNSGTIVGTPLSKTDGSGHSVTQIVKNNLGVDNQKRWFIADCSGAAGVEAVYVIGDISTNGTYWQMNTLKSQAITTDAATKSFTIAGMAGSSLKGRVLYQAGNITFKTGVRARGSAYRYYNVAYTENNYVHFQSTDGDYLVVLTVAKNGQTHPTPVVTGTWPGPVSILVGGFNVAINGDAINYGTTLVQNPRMHTTQRAPQNALIYDCKGRSVGLYSDVARGLKKQSVMQVLLIKQAGSVRAKKVVSGIDAR